jgi:hypothetical protein
VDIDLSSLGPEIALNRPTEPKPVTPAKRKIDGATTITTTSAADPDPPNLDNAGSNAEDAHAIATQVPQEMPAPVAETDQDIFLPFSSRVQILDLNSTNPIVSYQGQVFGCTWSDTVGTNMFFTHPGMTENAEPLKTTDTYDLIALSRIKLVAHRARLTEKGPKQTETTGDFIDPRTIDGNNSLPVERNPTNRAREDQAAFLEKLMEIKRRRGPADAVATNVDAEVASPAQQKTPASHREESQAFNEEETMGDASALARPPIVYSQPEERGSAALPDTPQKSYQPHTEADEVM